MVSQYKAQRKRHLFSALDTEPYHLSHSRIEKYIDCKRCFYLDNKLGIKRPSSFSYSLNSAVGKLLKNEFDRYRREQAPHPYLIEHAIDAVPFMHEYLDDWRMSQRGIKYLHEATNFIITGAIDDVWSNALGELIIVDYKTTSTQKEISLDSRESYKRQMEVYQWLFRKNEFNVSNTGYFVYCNGDGSRSQFAGALHFSISLLPYDGNDAWIENVLLGIKACLMSDSIPSVSVNCDYCAYYSIVQKYMTDRRKGAQFWYWLTENFGLR